MAEFACGAAPVPSITVTFFSTVDSASAGAVMASDARRPTPNFKPCISKLPCMLRCSRDPVLTRQARKKTAKTYAALRNETRPIGTRKMPSSLPEDGINHGLLPPYLCHPLDGTAYGRPSSGFAPINVLILCLVSSTSVSGLRRLH